MVGMMVQALVCVTEATHNSALYHTLTSPLFNHHPEELGQKAQHARRTHQSLWDMLITDSTDYKESIDKIKHWRSALHEKTVSALAYQILDETGLKDKLYASAESDQDAALAVQALGQWFETLREFQAVSTVGTAVAYLENFETLRASGEALDEADFSLDLPVVMSVHKAKGLEWDTVYIVDCTENSFPLKNSRGGIKVPDELSITSSADDHIAEERRLMYVACTRAKENLILSFSHTHTGTTARKPSRFLGEMFGDEVLPNNNAAALNRASLELLNANKTSSGEKRVPLPAKMRSGKNLLLTASQLNDYLRCPLDFYYRHVLGVPSEPNPASAVGTIFHDQLQRINVALINGQKAPSLDELVEELKEKWPMEGYLSAKQRTRAQEAAITALEKTYQRITSSPTPLASEKPFKMHVPGSNVVLTGRIDAVLPTESGGIQIVDYKTSTTSDTPEKAKRSTTSSKQLEMYALAWREMTGEVPESVSLDFVQTNQVGIVKKKPTTLDNLAAKIATAGEAIEAGDYTPGHSHNYCRHPG